MAEQQEQQDREREQALLSRFCFVHRVAELPLVAASVQQVLSYYGKTKNYNRLIGGSLNLAESSVKLAYSTTEPILKLFDGPIVATNKIACQQLDKLEQTFPVLKTTPEEFVRGSKTYYEQSYLKSGVDKAYSVVLYGENKVRSSQRLAGVIVQNANYLGHLSLFDLFNLGFKTINQTLAYSDSLIDSYIAPPDFQRFDSQDDNIRTMVHRMWYMSDKVYCGLKYKACMGVLLTRDQALYFIGQMQAIFTLLDYAKTTTNWMTDEAIKKFSTAQSQAGVLLRSLKENAQQFGRQPDQALLKLVQNTSSSFVAFSDYVHQRASRFLPQKLDDSVKMAVEYARELNDLFNEATTLGELRTEVLSEAREKFNYIQGVLLTVVDHLLLFPPISWLVYVTPSFITKSLTIGKNNAQASADTADKNKRD